jgi:hypothetical protein
LVLEYTPREAQVRARAKAHLTVHPLLWLIILWDRLLQ